MMNDNPTIDQRVVGGLLRCLASFAENGTLRSVHLIVRDDPVQPGVYVYEYYAYVTSEDGVEARLIYDPRTELFETGKAFRRSLDAASGRRLTLLHLGSPGETPPKRNPLDS